MSNARFGVFAVAFFLFAPPLHAQCVAPSVPVVQFAPSSAVAVGQTYAISWSEVTGGTGSYVVERSKTQDFASVEVQRVGVNGASFTSSAEGLYYHRVRAVPACDTSRESPSSATTPVTVTRGSAVVVVTVQPKGIVAGSADVLDQLRSTFTVENITRSAVTVAFDAAPIGSPAFFSIVDPAGGDVSKLTLSPGVPKQLEVRFSGVSVAQAGTFQGLISIRGVSETLAVTPYAYVNLKTGGSTNGTPPTFRLGETAVTFVSLPPYPVSFPDSARAPLVVDVVNSSNTPLDVAAEVGPEAWLTPQAGWNAVSIPPKSSIPMPLLVDRTRANRGSALPRYTYLTLRTKTGATARLLVQDNDLLGQATVPLPVSTPATRSFLLTRVANVAGSTGTFLSRMRVSNVSNFAIDADLYYNPVTNFLSPVPRTTIVVPPNDVVAVEDVLGQLFGSSNTFGNIEIRTAAENAQFLTVSASTYERVSGGELVFHIPVILRGEGARLGGPPFVVSGLTVNTALRAILTLIETGRQENVRVFIRLIDKTGVELGNATFIIPQAGERDFQVRSLFPSVKEFDAATVEVSVVGSDIPNGIVTPIVTLLDNFTQGPASIYVGRPRESGPGLSSTNREATKTITYTVLGAVGGPVLGKNYNTFLGLTSLDSPVDVLLSYRSSNFSSRVRVGVTVPAGKTIEIPDVLTSVFNVPAALTTQGMITIEANAPLNLYGRLISPQVVGSGIVGNLPIITSLSDAITSARAGFQRPVYFDGLEQSIDPTRGYRWSLSLSELVGEPATVTIRLYEAGNRTSPIAERDISLERREHRVLNTIFTALGLDDETHQKDRTNVQVTVIPKSGTGSVAAVASGFDNSTGTVVRFLLTPNGGVPASGVSRTASTRLAEPQPHRRSVGH